MAIDAIRQAESDGWAKGVKFMEKHYALCLKPWVNLRRQIRGLVNDRALNASERAAYRQVLRMMSEAAKITRRKFNA